MNIRFIKAAFKNFGTLGEVEFSFDQRGVSLLIGENRDSEGSNDNGSGKSTLLRGVFWVIYGVMGKNVLADKAIHKDENEAIGEVWMEVDGEPLYIKRSRKRNKATKILVEYGGNTFSEQKVIEDIVKLSKLQFCNLIILRGGDEWLFARATDADRRDIIADLIEISDIDLMKGEVESRLAVVTKEVQELEDKENSLCSYLSHDEQNLSRLKSQLADYKKQKQESSSSLASNELAKEDLVEARDKLEKELQECSENKGNEKEELEAQLQEVEEAISSVEEIRDSRLSKYEGKINAISVEVSNKKMFIKLKRERITEMTSLTSKGRCPTCGQDVSTLNEEEITSLKAEVENVMESLREQESIKEELVLKRDTFKEKAIKKLRKLRAKKDSLRGEIKEKETSQAELDLSERVRVLNAKVAKVNENIAGAKVLLSRIDEDIKKTTEYIKTTTAKIEELSSEIKRVRIQCAGKKEEIEDLQFWKKGFGPKGVSSLVIEMLLPKINQRIQHFANVLSGGDLIIGLSSYSETKSGTVKESIAINVENLTGGDDYPTQSSGEKARVDLAVAFGLASYFRDFGNTYSNLIAFDEIWDGIDERGMNNVFEAVKETDIDYSIFISHRRQFQSMFGSVYTMVKENGKSTLM